MELVLQRFAQCTNNGGRSLLLRTNPPTAVCTSGWKQHSRARGKRSKPFCPQQTQERSMSMVNKMYRATSFPTAHSCTFVGRRELNEDRLLVAQEGDVHLFAVLDGHGGPEIADISLRALVRSFEDTDPNNMSLSDMAATLVSRISEDANAFLDLHQDCRSGTTLALALRREDELVAANVGDSRIVLYGKGRESVITTLTNDHRPEREDEVNRITEAGGEIHWTGPYGRVNGQLAMTRAIGARYMRDFGVIDTPEITTTKITDNDYLLLLATDGLFDFTTNAQIEYELCQALMSDNYSKICSIASQKLVDASQWNHSKDNVTCVVAPLPGLATRPHMVAPAPLDLFMLRRS